MDQQQLDLDTFVLAAGLVQEKRIPKGGIQARHALLAPAVDIVVRTARAPEVLLGDASEVEATRKERVHRKAAVVESGRW